MSANRDDEPLLHLEKVERCFTVGKEEVVILKQIDLKIRRGELVAITGPSGSGKSTLMNILGCLDRPSAGSYRIGGQEVASLDSDRLARLRREHFGFVFQRYHLLPHLSADENVQIPAVYAGVGAHERRARASRLLARLGLAERAGYRPSELSGGQQQRVSIARALMNGGEVILADEPTGALDARSGHDMMRILLELNDTGHTVIIVTHDHGVAEQANRIIEIHDGEIIGDRMRARHEASPRESAGLQPARPRHDGGINSGSLGAALKIAWIAMVTHRMRTLLTMLGVIIGITAVTTVVALGQGAQRSVIDSIEAFGTHTVDLNPGRDWGDDRASSIHSLVEGDVAALRAQFYVDSVTPIVSSTQTLFNSNVKANASVRGVGEDYFRVHGIRFSDGQPIDEAQVRRRAQVVVIDDNTRKRFFHSWEQPVGKIILVGALPCMVIGVTARDNGLFDQHADLSVFIPYTTSADRLTGQSWFNGISARIRDGVPNQIAEQSIGKLIADRHMTRDFFVTSSDSVVQAVQKTTGTLTLLILLVAVVSLLAGGIGVMNIMLVSVSERTHEIGIRMAVGARQSDIMLQFLIEAVLMCLAGGLLGVLLSLLVGGIFALFVKVIVMRFSMLAMGVACACSMLTGVTFGFWPARNAARLDPVAALARE